MFMAVGVDGCPAGWIALSSRGLTFEFRVFPTIGELIEHFAQDTIAIDIPIGLTDAGSREIDVMTRGLLGASRSSVFPAPIRPVLDAANPERGLPATRNTKIGFGQRWGQDHGALNSDGKWNIV
jgi:predicted RNase H-like nuclease